MRAYRLYLPSLIVSSLLVLGAHAQIPGIGPVGQVTRAQMGFIFTEGPTPDAQGNIYFSDVQASRIYKLDTQGTLTIFLENTQGSNGLMFDPRGRLIACQSGAGRIVAIDVATKNIEVVADQFNNLRFNSPNDLVIDRQGGIYFSDPVFGNAQQVQDVQAVYYIAPNGTVTRIISNLTRPNGVRLSPDEKTLYVLHSLPNVQVYPVNAPGQLGTPQTFALTGNGAGDGMTVDATGNLYVTRPGNNAVQVLTPAGQSLGLINFAEAPSNCAFGGADMKTLYVTARTSVYTARMLTVGHRYAAPIASVSAASFTGASLTAEAITALFGNDLATGTATANTLPLPTTLVGTTIKVTDSTGTERLAPLFFVSPTQVNYQIPTGTMTGPAGVLVTTSNGTLFTGAVNITDVAPGLFSADARGQGLAAAVVLRIRADGTQSFEPVARFDGGLNGFFAIPIDLSRETDQVFLLLYGTGIRQRSALTNVNVKIGGIDAPVEYAGAQGDFAGLDQLNVRLPRSLAGRGGVEVMLTVDGQLANVVRVHIR